MAGGELEWEGWGPGSAGGAEKAGQAGAHALNPWLGLDKIHERVKP